MLAAGLVASVDLLQTPNLPTLLTAFIPGFLTAAITGYLAIRWMLKYLTRHPLTAFAIYCVLVSLITLGTNILGVIPGQ